MEKKLYHHKTSGGAEYLFDRYIIAPNGDREGTIQGASIAVRLDGHPEISIREPELTDHLPKSLQELLEYKTLINTNSIADLVLKAYHLGKEDQKTGGKNEKAHDMGE